MGKLENDEVPPPIAEESDTTTAKAKTGKAAKPLRKLKLSKETLRNLEKNEIHMGYSFFCPVTGHTCFNCPTQSPSCCSCYFTTGA